MRNKQASVTIIMSLRRKGFVLSIKDKQSISLRLEKGEKGTNLSAEYGVSKQQISDIRKNKERIMKFADNLETSGQWRCRLWPVFFSRELFLVAVRGWLAIRTNVWKVQTRLDDFWHSYIPPIFFLKIIFLVPKVSNS